jgi:hypothetical protein
MAIIKKTDIFSDYFVKYSMLFKIVADIGLFYLHKDVKRKFYSLIYGNNSYE